MNAHTAGATAAKPGPQLFSFVVTTTILKYFAPQRSVDADHFTPSMMVGNPDHAVGAANRVSAVVERFTHRDPRLANARAKEIISAYEADKVESELVGALREDGTIWYAAILLDGSERCEVQVRKDRFS